MRIAKYIHEKVSPKITILSIVTTRGGERIEKTIKDLFENLIFYKIGAYWAVHNEDSEIEGYNCCKAFNEASEQCNSDIIIYSTGDVLIPAQLLWRAYGQLLLHNLPVFAYRMDEQEGGSWKENNDALGDFIVCKKEWVVEVGGWDQRLFQWGVQDYDFLGRLGLLLQKDYNNLGVCMGPRPEDRVQHFYHPRKSDEWYREQNKKNWGIIKEQGLWNKEIYNREREKVLIENYSWDNQ